MNIIFFMIPKNNIEYLDDTNTVRQAIEKIRVKGYTSVPIVSKTDGTYIGTVSEGDFLWHIINNNYFNVKELEDVLVVDIINKGRYQTVSISAKVDDLLNLIKNQNYVPVVDDRGIFMGIITRRRVIEYYYSLAKEQHND